MKYIYFFMGFLFSGLKYSVGEVKTGQINIFGQNIVFFGFFPIFDDMRSSKILMKAPEGTPDFFLGKRSKKILGALFAIEPQSLASVHQQCSTDFKTRIE